MFNVLQITLMVFSQLCITDDFSTPRRQFRKSFATINHTFLLSIQSRHTLNKHKRQMKYSLISGFFSIKGENYYNKCSSVDIAKSKKKSISFPRRFLSSGSQQMPRNYLMSKVSRNTLYQPNSVLEMVMKTKYYFPTIHSVLKENGGKQKHA